MEKRKFSLYFSIISIILIVTFYTFSEFPQENTKSSRFLVKESYNEIENKLFSRVHLQRNLQSWNNTAETFMSGNDAMPKGDQLGSSVAPTTTLKRNISQAGETIDVDNVDMQPVYYGSPELYKIPNIVHFIYFSSQSIPMSFTESISVLSAVKIQKPEVVYFHCNNKPYGQYWLELIEKSKGYLKTMHRDIPRKIAGVKIRNRIHAINIAKLEILKQYGGIVLDTDVVIISSLDDLRTKHDMVMGKEKAQKLSDAIILASKDSTFLHKWYNKYLTDYRPDSTDYNCCVVPFKLYTFNYSSVYVEPFKLTTPDWLDKQLLFTDNSDSNIISWRQLYVVHMMFTNQREAVAYNPAYIKSLRKLIGKALRLIYYGSADELSDWLTLGVLQQTSFIYMIYE